MVRHATGILGQMSGKKHTSTLTRSTNEDWKAKKQRFSLNAVVAEENNPNNMALNDQTVEAMK
jgi:hypothetical protein